MKLEESKQQQEDSWVSPADHAEQSSKAVAAAPVQNLRHRTRYQSQLQAFGQDDFSSDHWNETRKQTFANSDYYYSAGKGFNMNRLGEARAFNKVNEQEEGSQYQLMKSMRYRNSEECPMKIFISLEALIILNVHSHLSKNEVIGYLAGYCFQNKTTRQ